jgi:hypothetical protein
VIGRSKDQDLIDWLVAKIQGLDPKTAQINGHTRTAPGSPTDEMVIEKCRAASNAAKFSDLFESGDVHAHHGGDDSRADLALLSMLTFWTQDEAQLERIFSGSALGQREKWRRRHDYREMTIQKALSDLGETYSWPGEARERTKTSSSSSDTPGVGNDDENKKSAIKWFHELGEPQPRRFVIEKVARKGYPLVIYGAGGVAKSFAALASGIAIASGRREWLGLEVLEHGVVLYLDFELDENEQLIRVHELCTGLGIGVPEKLAYLSGRGMDRAEAFRQAHTFADEHKAVAVIVDSVGQAVTGDMDKNRDVNAFYRDHIEPFNLYGTTPILVDHQGKLQGGEKHKDKSIIGGVYKANNARGVLQFILEEYDKEEHRLDIRVRVPKINFEPPEPFGISIIFESGQVSIKTRILPDEELMDEDRKPVRDRILAALRIESQTVPDLEKHTGAAAGTIYNNLSRLMDDELVTEDGYYGRKKLYRLFSSSSHTPRASSDDENKNGTQAGSSENKDAQATEPMLQETPITVAEFFADPPGWFSGSLKMYHQNPEMNFRVLCAHVAAALDDTGELRPEEVVEEVEQALAKREGDQ